MTVKLNKKGLNKLKANLRFLDGAAVDTGFFNGELHDDKNTMATIALWQEYGTDKGKGKGNLPGIPERPFMSQTYLVNGKYRAIFRREAQMILLGQSTTSRSLDRMGRRIRKDMKTSLDLLVSPPNAPSTIKRKRSSKPLIETGALRNGIKFRKRMNRSRRI